MKHIIGLLLAALAWLSPAVAQQFPTVPDHTVIGRIGTGSGSGPSQAIPFATLNSSLLNSMCATSGAFPIYNAITGLWVCSTAGGTGSKATLNGGPLTISPTASSSTRGLVVNQTGPASGTTTGDSSSNCWGASPSLVYNYICVDGEGANVTGAPPVFTYGLDVGLVTGGANSTGAKQAGLFYLYKASASNPATPRDHVALGATGLVQAGDGGTGTGIGNSKGTMFATSFQVIARSGATNLFEVSGGEVDCSITTGASASYRFCWNIVSGGQVAGAVLDAGLVFGAAGLPFNNGILFADANGIAPISATGCAICSSGSATIDSAIDFGSYTITSYLIRGPHSYLDGAGNGLFENTVVIGKTGTAPGVAQFKGSTSGMATITAQAVAGTPTLFLPTGAGTFAVSATLPLSLNATTGALSCSTCLTTASFANPTASIGLSAVNGSAVTAMRSDAAPALSQAIVPIWTGVHTHTPSQAANTSTDGIALADATAATAGNQQYSPRLRLTAQGWKTNATAASQQADWIIENVPVQGAASPDSYLKFSSQINGAGYTELFSFRNSVNSGQTTFYINNAATSQFQLAVGGTATGVHYVDATQYIFGALTAIPVKVYTSNAEKARFFDSGCFAVGTTTDCGSGGILANSSIKSQSASAGIGYATGAGGTVTQGTSRTTGVTINKVTGQITMFSAAGSATPATFTVTNSAVAATDTVHLSIASGATNVYSLSVSSTGAGSFVITFYTTGGTATDAPVINFAVIKGVTASNDNFPLTEKAA